MKNDYRVYVAAAIAICSMLIGNALLTNSAQAILPVHSNAAANASDINNLPVSLGKVDANQAIYHTTTSKIHGAHQLLLDNK